MNSKIETYIGFAIKKGSVVFGYDSVKLYRKKMFLFLCVKGIAENSFAKMTQLSTERNIPLLVIDDCNCLSGRNCKALAICDKSLADAIITTSANAQNDNK